MGMAGATALVTAMTTDGWSAVRAWIGRWLGRGHAQEESHHLVRLDRDRELLLAASGSEQADEAQQLVTAWAVRFQDVAEIGQDAALELVQWLAQWQAENPVESGKESGVRQKAKASGRARITQIGGSQIILPPRRS